jgi:hypothetical protein
MKLLAVIFGLFVFASCATSTGRNNNSKDTDDSNLINFTNFNTILSFYKQNDSLFCNTGSGILYYNKASDEWLIDKIINPSFNGKGDHYCNFRNIPPPGYKTSVYTLYCRQHGSWLLISHAGEGADYYKQEIVDTSQKRIFRLPYEGINDFIVEDGFIWVGSDFGISRIEMKSLKRIDYYMLPAFKKITSVVETVNAIFYLDFHYGLFKYNKLTKIVSPVEEVNTYTNDFEYPNTDYARDSNLKYCNSFLLDSCLYIIGCNMDKSAFFLNGTTYILVYNIRTNEVKKIETNIDYLDAFVHFNNFLIAYGEWVGRYEGGDIVFYGGAVAYDLKNNHLIELTDIPIVSLTKGDNGLDAISILDDDYYAIVSYKKLKLFEGFYLPVKNYVIQSDTFYYLRDFQKKDGETVFFDNPNFSYKKNVVINKKQYDKFSTLYQSINKQRTTTSDSILRNLQFKPTMIKIENKTIQYDLY